MPLRGGVSGSSSNGDICDKITVVLAWTGDPIAGNAERKKDKEKRRSPQTTALIKKCQQKNYYMYYIISDTEKQ